MGDIVSIILLVAVLGVFFFLRRKGVLLHGAFVLGEERKRFYDCGRIRL